MTINATAIKGLLAELAQQYPVFCSEMDFQLHLAWLMKQRGYEVSLEFDPRCFERNVAIDIFIHAPERVAVELKYKTTVHEYERRGQKAVLKSQSAQDVGRYDFLKDIVRIETVVAARQAVRGYAILVTNDRGYWQAGKAKTVDEAFRIFEGRRVARGEYRWGDGASKGTMKTRELPLLIASDHLFAWADYSSSSAKNGLFRYLMVEVEAASATAAGA